MIRKKLRWYRLFESDHQLEELFGAKDAVVHRFMFGEILFVRSTSGVHAFKNRCPHQNKPLDDCKVIGERIVCPFHQYHFSCEDGRGHGLYVDKYKLEFREDGVYLGKEVWSFF